MEVNSTLGHIFITSFKEKMCETIARSGNFFGKKYEFACHPYIVLFSSLDHCSCRLCVFRSLCLVMVLSTTCSLVMVLSSLPWLFTVTKNIYFDFAFLLYLCWKTFFSPHSNTRLTQLIHFLENVL